MATRARIGLKLEDGTIKHSYVHWDGYPLNVGACLVSNYDSVAKITELLSFGDMSSLGMFVKPFGEHSFDNPESNVCVFYGRDRGETDIHAKVSTLDEFLSAKYAIGLDYIYLFSNDNWWVKMGSNWKLVKSFIPEYNLTKEDLACTI
jgi:hypothetical protein